MRYYTGIGSRETPDSTLAFMTQLAIALEAEHFSVRSGGAQGADTAFGQHVYHKQVFLPWQGFSGLYESNQNILIRDKDLNQEAHSIASKIHPAWNRCSEGAKTLHSRNVFQILGPDLNSPSEFVICWTKGGKSIGGTRTAIVLAQQYEIPVYNLGDPSLEDHHKLISILETNHSI